MGYIGFGWMLGLGALLCGVIDQFVCWLGLTWECCPSALAIGVALGCGAEGLNACQLVSGWVFSVGWGTVPCGLGSRDPESSVAAAHGLFAAALRAFVSRFFGCLWL